LANGEGTPVEGDQVLQLFGSIEDVGGNRGFWLKAALHLAGRGLPLLSYGMANQGSLVGRHRSRILGRRAECA